MGYHLNFQLIWRHFDKLWGGLLLSLELAVISIAIGIVIGLVLAVWYVSAGRVVRGIIAAYVEFIRNVPLILLVYLVFYGLPTVVDLVYETGTKKGRIHPTVRFRARDGREVVATVQQHQNAQPGQTVQVLYDASKPDEVDLETLERVKHRRALLTALALAMGILVCTLGIGLDPNTLEWRFKRRS